MLSPFKNLTLLYWTVIELHLEISCAKTNGNLFTPMSNSIEINKNIHVSKSIAPIRGAGCSAWSANCVLNFMELLKKELLSNNSIVTVLSRSERKISRGRMVQELGCLTRFLVSNTSFVNWSKNHTGHVSSAFALCLGVLSRNWS